VRSRFSSGYMAVAARAEAVLPRLLPAGAAVRLEADPVLDKEDKYGRLLRYVFRGKTNINLVLVEKGAASFGSCGRGAWRTTWSIRLIPRTSRGKTGGRPGGARHSGQDRGRKAVLSAGIHG
jgi:endonuclease YncB( thermonuclease family)